MLELVVVMSITSLLAGLLLPALSEVRENANRVLCGSNQRQLGQAIIMFGGSRNNKLPYASVLDDIEPNSSELSKLRNATHVESSYSGGGYRNYVPVPLQDESWDGLGRLFRWHYCSAPEIYYCPSHEGEHTLDKCQEMWKSEPSNKVLYGNYQYVGHKNWRTGRQSSLLTGEKLTLVTDGLRTKIDYSHGDGYNKLRGDGSVVWITDAKVPIKLTILPPADIDGLRNLDDIIFKIFFGEE